MANWSGFQALRVLYLFTLASQVYSPHCSAEDRQISLHEETTYKKALYSWPVTFDPARMNDAASLVFSNLVYEGLLRFKSDLSVEGALADRWETSPDGKEIIFHLRQDARFHDGSAVLSSDVVYSLNRLFRKDSLVSHLYLNIRGVKSVLSGKEKFASGITILDPYTVKIVLEKPYPPIMSILAGGTAKIFPEAKITKKSDQMPFLGAGPFQLVSLNRNEKPAKIVLKRFPAYHMAPVMLEKLELLALDETEALRLAKLGEIHDLANWPLSGKESVFDVGQHLVAPQQATWIIGLNSRLAPFRSSLVRRAFRDSFRHEEFRKRFYADAIPAYGYVPTGLPGYREIPQNQNSIALSKTEVKEVEAAKKHIIHIRIPDSLSKVSEMSQWIDEEFARTGWTVQTIPTNWEILMRAYTNKTDQAFLVSMNMDYPESEFLVENFRSTNPDNFSGIKNRKIDTLLSKLRSSNDRVERSYLYHSIIEEVEREAPTINLFHPRLHMWSHACVSGLKMNLLTDAIIDYRVVGFKKDCLKSLKITASFWNHRSPEESWHW